MAQHPNDDQPPEQAESASPLINPAAANSDHVETASLLSELEPFEPPSSFDHGEEFEAETPRPIPKYLREGSHGRRNRGVTYSLIALGIMFVIFSPIPFVQGLSVYILPLKWLHWIGFGLIGIGVWTFLSGFVSTGRFAYVKNGEPFVGRVLDCQKVDTGTEEIPSFRHMARIEYQHPVTSEHVIMDFPEPDNWSTSKLNQMSCTLTRGEYVTLVHLPDKDDASHTVYGFLGLDPERELILKNGEPMRGTSPFSAIMVAFVIAFIVGLLMAAFDVVMFAFPIGGDWKLPVALAVGGFVLGGILGILIWKNNKATGKSEGPIASFIGIGFLGAVSLPLIMIILNAHLDHSPTTLTPIEIVEFWNTTHNFVIRDYELEYRELHGGAPQKKHLRFSQITRLYGSRYGVLEMSPGRFGYTWVKGFHPIYWLNVDEAKFNQPVVEFLFEAISPESEPVSNETVKMVPVISLSDGQQAALPKGLLKPELNYLETQPGIISLKVISTAEAE